MNDLTRHCVFGFPGIPLACDILTTLHYSHGIEEILLPKELESWLNDKEEIDIKKDMPFVKVIPISILESAEKKAAKALEGIGIYESICSRFSDEFYIMLLQLFKEWYTAKNLNAQISLLTQIPLYDAINVLAYEYASILPNELSKELVAWIYANTASHRSNIQFFEVKHRHSDITSVLSKHFKEQIIRNRLQLARATSVTSKHEILSKTSTLINETRSFVNKQWPEALKITAQAIIAIFINPIAWITTALDSIKHSRTILSGTRSRKNPMFSLERTYHIDITIPTIDHVQNDFQSFWKQARAGRLLAHDPIACKCHR